MLLCRGPRPAGHGQRAAGCSGHRGNGSSCMQQQCFSRAGLCGLPTGEHSRPHSPSHGNTCLSPRPPFSSLGSHSPPGGDAAPHRVSCRRPHRQPRPRARSAISALPRNTAPRLFYSREYACHRPALRPRRRQRAAVVAPLHRAPRPGGVAPLHAALRRLPGFPRAVS